MAVTRADLRAILNKDDADLVEQARQPGLAALSSEDLRQLSTRLRERRDKANQVVVAHRRATKGRGNTSGVEKIEVNQRRHAAIYAEALSRANKERTRRVAQARRAEHVANAHRALSRKQSAGAPNHPGSDATAKSGMRAKDNSKTKKVGSPTKNARTSQANKVAQAKKDSR